MGAGVRPFLLWTLSDWLWKVLLVNPRRTYPAS